MTRILTIVIVAVVAVAAGCSSISVRSDYDRDADFNTYQTFGWLPQPTSSISLRSTFSCNCAMAATSASASTRVSCPEASSSRS